MSVISILRDTPNNVSLVRMISTDTVSAVAGANYIANQMNNIRALNSGSWQWYITDMIMCSCSDGNALYEFTDATFSTVEQYGQTGPTGQVTPQQVQSSAFTYSTDSGSSGNNYVISLSPPLLANSEDVLILMTPANTNTVTNPTLKINALPALPIELNGGVPLTIGDLLINNTAILVYNATQNAYILQNPVNIVTQNGIIHQSYTFGVESGAANAYVVTTLTNPITYTTGTVISFAATNSNTGASTVNVDALGAVPIVLNGNIPLSSNMIVANGIYNIVYSQSYSAFVLMNASEASGLFIWNDQAASGTAAVNNGYIIDHGATLVTMTLPVTAPLGSIVAIAGNSSGGWVLAAGAGQTIKFNSQSASTSLASTNQYNCIEVICVVANTTWAVRSSEGNLTVV